MTPPGETLSRSVEGLGGVLESVYYLFRSEITLPQADTCRLHPEKHCEKNRAKRRECDKRNVKENKTTQLGRRRKTRLKKKRHSEQIEEPY